MIKFCKKCVESNLMVSVFDENGINTVGNGIKNQINWVNRKNEFFKLIEPLKVIQKNGNTIKVDHNNLEKTPLQLP